MEDELWQTPIDSVTMLPRAYDTWPPELQQQYILDVATMTPPGYTPELLPPLTD